MSFTRSCFVKACFALFFWCMTAAIHGQVIQYWPLSDGDKIGFKYSFDENHGDAVTIVRSLVVGDQTVLYGIDERDLSSENPIIGTQFPGPGVLIPADNGIYGANCFWLKDLATLDLSKKILLLQYPLKKGNKTGFTSPSGDMTATYVVEGFENVTVPAGTYEECAKISVHRKWKAGTEYSGAFWLAPGTGMVKWQRHTGRLDELKNLTKGQ